jgi:hypothetical protein
LLEKTPNKNYRVPCIVIPVVFDEHVYIDRPQVGTVLIGVQQAIIHSLRSFDVAIFELKLCEFVYNVNVFKKNPF